MEENTLLFCYSQPLLRTIYIILDVCMLEMVGGRKKKEEDKMVEKRKKLSRYSCIPNHSWALVETNIKIKYESQTVLLNNILCMIISPFLIKTNYTHEEQLSLLYSVPYHYSYEFQSILLWSSRKLFADICLEIIVFKLSYLWQNFDRVLNLWTFNSFWIWGHLNPRVKYSKHLNFARQPQFLPKKHLC